MASQNEPNHSSNHPSFFAFSVFSNANADQSESSGHNYAEEFVHKVLSTMKEFAQKKGDGKDVHILSAHSESKDKPKPNATKSGI